LDAVCSSQFEQTADEADAVVVVIAEEAGATAGTTGAAGLTGRGVAGVMVTESVGGSGVEAGGIGDGVMGMGMVDMMGEGSGGTVIVGKVGKTTVKTTTHQKMIKLGGRSRTD